MTPFRRWPNESLVSWFSMRYGHLREEERIALRILEVGCGAGNNLRLFFELGFYQVTGIDLSLTALQEVKRTFYYENGMPLLLERDVRDLKLCPEYYDLVVDVTCLQHLSVTDHEIALAEIHDVLKPGGILFSYRLADGTAYRDLFPTEPPVWLATVCALRAQCARVGFTHATFLHRKREYDGDRWANYIQVEAIK